MEKEQLNSQAADL